MKNNTLNPKKVQYLYSSDIEKISGKLEFEILRNKKPEIFATPGFDISLYYYSKSIPNHEALPL